MTNEQKAVELVREYTRAYDEFQKNPGASLHVDFVKVGIRIRTLGRKLLEADNAKPNL